MIRRSRSSRLNQDPPNGPTIFAGDYAHINSVQLIDGQIVTSLRGCSKVLGIDAESGDVLWRVGRSNLSEEK